MSTVRTSERLQAALRGVCLVLLMLWTGHAAVADQNAAELPDLFGALEQATSASQAQAIEAQIWQHWLVAPDKASAAVMTEVLAAMQIRDLPSALRLCNELIDVAPDYAEAWNKRATVHYLMGDSDASVADIRRTLVLEPRHFGAISGLGLIFMRSGNLPAALQAFEEVLRISPSSENAQRSVAQVREQIEREI